MTSTTDYPALRARGLAKRFGEVRAVRSINLDLAPGEALGLLGPNGAGKSTTLSMLMGLRRPDAGETHVFGHLAGSARARAVTGATPQSSGFPEQLSPRELIAYAAARYRVEPQTDALVERFGLERLIDRRVAGFSGGEMRRVALALAFAGAPKLVFLDEPTTGLDTASQEGFRDVARDYVAQGGALILTSHHWDEIEAICGSIAMIDRGETVLSGRLDEIRARARAKQLSFQMPETALPPEWLGARLDRGTWRVETDTPDATLRRMVAEDLPFRDLTLQPIELKDLIERIRAKETQK